MILLLRLTAALGLSALFAFASLRLERRLGGPAADHAPAHVTPAEAQAELDAAAASQARRREELGGFELRVFQAGGIEHRGPLRALLHHADGERLGLAFAAAPYRCDGLEPGEWVLELEGPVLAGRSATFRAEPGTAPRLDVTTLSPLRAELGPRRAELGPRRAELGPLRSDLAPPLADLDHGRGSADDMPELDSGAPVPPAANGQDPAALPASERPSPR